MKKKRSKKLAAKRRPREITVPAWGLYSPRHDKFIRYIPAPDARLAPERPAIYLNEYEAAESLAASKRYSPHTDYQKVSLKISYTPPHV
jgi:hypothetical protein